MDDATFWSLIDRLDWRHEGDDDRVVMPVVKALRQMPLDEIESFEEILARKLHALDGRDWAREIGAGWWGGEALVSVDEFLYARCVVVANGKDFYEAVVADPTTMPKDLEFEALLGIASTAWQKKTGEEPTFMASVSYETFSNEAGWPPGPLEPEVPRPPAWAPSGETRRTTSYDEGKRAVRRVIRALVTGELAHPVLAQHLSSSGRILVMTPGRGVEPPPEPEQATRGPLFSWEARIPLWTTLNDAADRRPSGLTAVISLRRVSQVEVDAQLVDVELPT